MAQAIYVELREGHEYLVQRDTSNSGFSVMPAHWPRAKCRFKDGDSSFLNDAPCVFVPADHPRMRARLEGEWRHEAAVTIAHELLTSEPCHD